MYKAFPINHHKRFHFKLLTKILIFIIKRYTYKRITVKYMRVVYKVWLDNNGKAFGNGPYELLNYIKKTKSLHKAASRMGMSYSKAWRLIRDLEKRLGFTLIERKVGGHMGGGSKITDEAKRFMKIYDKFRKDIQKTIPAIYKRYFESFPDGIIHSNNKTADNRGRN